MTNRRNIAKRSANTTDIVCENEEHNIEVIRNTLLKCEDQGIGMKQEQSIILQHLHASLYRPLQVKLLYHFAMACCATTTYHVQDETTMQPFYSRNRSE